MYLICEESAMNGFLSVSWLRDTFFDGNPIYSLQNLPEIKDSIIVLFTPTANSIVENFLDKNNKVYYVHLMDTMQNPKFHDGFHGVFTCFSGFPGAWIPLGCSIHPRGVKSLKPMQHRGKLCTFVGRVTGRMDSRNEVKFFMNRIKEMQFIETMGFSKGFRPQYYAHIMEESRFVPCPAGLKDETFRFFDALELGCIPISLNYEFLENNFHIQPPLIVERWADLTNIPQISMEETLRLSEECKMWWLDTKKKYYDLIHNTIFE